MKWKLFSIMLAVLFVLAACNGNNGNNGGNDGNDDGKNNNDNVEQTRFEGDTGTDNMNDRNNGNRTRNKDDQGKNGPNGNNNEDQYELADKAANKIANEVDSIDNAYVVKTDNNAYVAAEMDRDNNNGNNMNNDNNASNNGTTNNNNNKGGDVTDEVKEQISDIVKSVDSDVDNVYVSTNPDFLDLMNNYADDADNDEPVEGLFDQMGNMIERVFPERGNH